MLYRNSLPFIQILPRHKTYRLLWRGKYIFVVSADTTRTTTYTALSHKFIYVELAPGVISVGGRTFRISLATRYKTHLIQKWMMIIPHCNHWVVWGGKDKLNGRRRLKFCFYYDLALTNSYFKTNPEHKVSWH